MGGMAQVRPYRGVEAPQRIAERRRRLLEAGLDLLGGTPAPADLTVRAICSQSGLAARYFYESFDDKDAFVAAVFDWVVADIATTTQAAISAAPMREQSQQAMANVVRTIADDVRVGRLLFSVNLSNPVVVRKRAQSSALFALLSGQHAGTALQLEPNERIRAASHFVVGGVAQTLSAWLAGDLDFTPEQLAVQLAALIDQLGNPELYRDEALAARLRRHPAVRRRLRRGHRVAVGEFLGPAGELQRDAVRIEEVERPHVDAGVQLRRRPAPRSRRG